MQIAPSADGADDAARDPDVGNAIFYARIVVLRFSAAGAGHADNSVANQVLVGLALFVSLLVMQPVANDVYHKSWEPLEAGKINASDAWDLATPPIKTFLLKFAREKDIRLFVWLSRIHCPRVSRQTRKMYP